MARNRITIPKLNNAVAFDTYYYQMETLAENVFVLDIPADNIWIPYINNALVHRGSIAFFVDPVLGLIALPYEVKGRRDIYGRPITIQCHGSSGYRSKNLGPGEYVIMYDNTTRRSLISFIRYYASKMAQTSRTADINVNQQKTPRIIKTSTGSEYSVKNLFKEIDANEEAIFASKDFDVNDIVSVLMPAPYVADKLDMHADRCWNEFCRLIGIGNITETKRERLITDEVNALQAGAIAGRWSRYIPRVDAIDELNKKFAGFMDGEASVKYYDATPGMNDTDGDIYDSDDYEEGSDSENDE